MEVTEILEKYSDDDNDCDIPDNIIYVIFPESDPPENVESFLAKTCSDELTSANNEEQKHHLSSASELFSIAGKCDELTTPAELEFHNDYISNVHFINKENKQDVAVQTDDSDDLPKLSGTGNLLEYSFYEEKETEMLDLIKLDSDERKTVTPNLTNKIEFLKHKDETVEREKNFKLESSEDEKHSITDNEKSMEGATTIKKGSINSTINRKLKKKRKKIKNMLSLKCKHCSLDFSTFSSLQKHSKLVHNSADFSFPCNICGQSFTRPHNLSRHKETRHREGDKKYECEHCGRKFGRQDIFTSHMRLMHSTGESTSTKANHLHQCSSCKKYFAKLHNYKKHLEGNLSCTKCSLSFPCKRSYREHLNKQHSVTCDTCGKTCQSKQQMYAHKLTHTPKFKCEFCGKGFIWESPYVIHLATHTGIRPVNCDICGKSFAHANAVKKHKWQDHTEANRKHRCKLCGKGFVYKAKLDNHIRIHSGKRPFPCQLCSSYFSQQRNLIAHMRVIHGTLEDSVIEIEEKSESQENEASDEEEDEIQTESVIHLQPTDELTVHELPIEEFQTFEDVPIDNFGSEGLIIKEIDSDVPIYQIIYDYSSWTE